MIFESWGNKVFMHDNLARFIRILCYNVLNQENDGLIIIDGKEGGGKSKLSRQIGGYCAILLNREFSINNISFTIKDYVGKSLKDRKNIGRVNILDESREALNRRKFMRNQNVEFGNFLSECRILRQIHIIVLPKFHDLEHYVAEHRVNLLVHVILKETITNIDDEKFGKVVELKRGSYKMYKRDSKLIDCYRNSRDKYPFQRDRRMYGTFKDHETLDSGGLIEYMRMKIDKLESYGKTFEVEGEEQEDSRKLDFKDLSG